MVARVPSEVVEGLGRELGVGDEVVGVLSSGSLAVT